MTANDVSAVIGAGVDRVDGPLKVMGAAPYSSDVSYPGLVHGALVRSTVAAGRISEVDTSVAEACPGVLMVVTHENAPRLQAGPMTLLGPSPPAPLQDDRILHYGQYVAVVLAETRQQAVAAARLVGVRYQTVDALLDGGDARGELRTNPWATDVQRGDAAGSLASADVTLEATYTTAENTNNPLGPFATVARWNGDTVTVHDATQWASNTRTTVAAAFGIPEDAVHVRAPYVGGGFGSGLRVWQHVILTALAARMLRRPVEIVLTRPQMFTGVGHRPNSAQTIRLGASRNGRLSAIEHEALQTVAMEDDNFEPIAASSVTGYACPNVSTRDLQRRLNIPCPGSMRAPGSAQGNFAIECAIDELSYALGIDPLELRLRNYAEVHPQSGRPWSSKALRECYTVGAERFGWTRRTPEVGSMRDGHWQVGYGLAGVTYEWWQPRCEARISVTRDGTAVVRSAAADIGTGTYTVMTQLAAELLGLELDEVRVELGDSDSPWSPAAGGSGLVGALGNAIYAARHALVQSLLDTVANDAGSPLRGCGPDDIVVSGGRLERRGHPGSGETYGEILARHGLEELAADGANTPPDPTQISMAPAGAFAAKFVEVHVDASLGLVRVARIVSVVDGGRILNAKLARSQIIGGTVGGIGQALLEETVTDEVSGRIANGTFGDYLVPVNADVPEMDVVFVGRPDRLTPIGTKGVGEIGLPGIAAAIANGVYHATGRRIRSLPITLDRLI